MTARTILLVGIVIGVPAGLARAQTQPPAETAAAKPAAEPDEAAEQPPADPTDLTPVSDPRYQTRVAGVVEAPRMDGTRRVPRRVIDERVARTTPEILQDEPGIFVQRTNYGGGAPIIRGQIGGRVLLLVDGIRLNNSTIRQGPNQYLNTVDQLLVHEMEIIRGPGSARYGSDAIGGAINILSALPHPGRDRVFGVARARSATFDRSLGLSVIGGATTERTGAHVTASARHYGNLTGGGGTGLQPFTGYEEYTASAAGVQALGDDGRLILNAQGVVQLDVPRTDRSTPRDFRIFSRQVRVLTYGRYERDLHDTKLRTTLSFQRQGEISDRYRIDRDRHEREDNEVDTVGAQFAIGRPRRDFNLGGGIDLYVDFIRSAASRGAIADETLTLSDPTRYPTGSGYLSATAYGYVERKLADWRLAAEGRAGAVRISLPEDDRLVATFPAEMLEVIRARSDWIPVYGAGLRATRPVTPWLSATAGLALGFRAPNVDDYARIGAEGPGYVVGGEAVDPERAWSGELGLFVSRDGSRGEITYAYTYIDDAISLLPAPVGSLTMVDGMRLLRSTNAESAQYHSIEASARVGLPRALTIDARVAWTRGAQRRAVVSADPTAPTTYLTEPASKVPPLGGGASLTWRPSRRGFVTLGGRFALAQTRLSENDRADIRICPDLPFACEGTPGWVELGARAGIDINESLRAFVSVENLLDATYREHASGIDGPGRGIAVVVEGRR